MRLMTRWTFLFALLTVAALSGCSFDKGGLPANNDARVVDDGAVLDASLPDAVPDANPELDDDNDGVLNGVDNCIDVANPNQDNSDNDSWGDACDNCVTVDNEDQADVVDGGDGIGDACDGCCEGMRGDGINEPIDELNIGDLVHLVLYMFQQGPEPLCMEEADVVADGGIDIVDLVHLVMYMFTQGDPPDDCPW